MSYIKSSKRCAKKPAVSLGVALVSSLALGSHNVLANDNNSVEEVLVEGHQSSMMPDVRGNLKFTEPVSRTPKTLQIISSDIINQQHATTLSEALRNTPGVGTFSLGEGGNTDTGDSIFMRGFYATGSIFADGIRDSGNYSRDTFNTEQVEVLKGADGSAFGRTSQGGAINVVSKMAKKGDSSEITASYGTHNQRRTTFDSNQQISDNVAFRLNLMGEKSNVPGRDKVKNKSWGIAPSLTLWFGDAKLSLNYMHLDQDNTPDGGVPTIGLKSYASPLTNKPELSQASEVRYKNFYGSNSDFDKVKVDMFTVAYENHLADNFILHNTARWGRTEQKYAITSFNASVSGRGTPNVINQNTWDLNDLEHWLMDTSRHAKDQSNSIITNQLGLINIVSTGLVEQTISYGVELTREEVKIKGVEAVGFNYSQNVYHPQHSDHYQVNKTGKNTDGTVDTYAVYLFDTVKIGDDWQLNGGVRLDRYRAKYKSFDATLTDKTSKNLFAWQLGALYQVTKNTNIYASYSVGEQPPGSDSLVLSAKDNNADNPNFKPQKAKTAELGSKWKLADDKLLLSAAVFRTEIGNQVEQDTSGEYHQNGEKRVDGIEITAVGQITDEWTLTTGYTHMRGKVLKGAPAAQGDSTDLSYMPSDAFTAWTSYQLPLGFSIGAGARYMGKIKREAKGNGDGVIDYAEAYWVGDMMLGYSPISALDFQLNIYNIADTRYVASVNRNGQRYTPHTPRTAILTAKYKF